MTQPPTFPEFSDGRRRDIGPAQTLREIPDLAAEALATAYARNPGGRAPQTRRPKPGSRPPANLDVIDALRPDPDGIRTSVHSEIAQAVRAVWEDNRDLELPEQSTIAGDCAWLVTHESLWASDEFLLAFVSDSARMAYGMLQRLVRTEREVRFRCPRTGCGDRAHMQPGGQWLQCESGHSLDVNAERGRFLSMQDWTLTETHSALWTYLGQSVPLDTLKTWVKRGKIEPVDERRPLRFNFGAVCKFIDQRKIKAG